MSRAIIKGSTDQSVVIRIVDSTDGTPETGVTAATSGLELKYRREGAAASTISASDLSALDDAHSDGGLLHIGAGYYRLDLPDAAVAAGADGVLVFGTATDMVVIGAYHELVDAKITGDPYARLGAPAGASIAADVAAVKSQTAAIEADTQDLQTQIGPAGAGLTAVPWNSAWDAEVQSEAADALAAYDPPTKSELDSAVAGLATASALSTVDGVVDAIKAKTDNLPSDPADQSELESLIAALDQLIDAIKAKTDQLTFTQSGLVDANLQAINDTAVSGTGVEGDEWGPAS